MPVINGVYSDGSLEAAKIARMAQDLGASALLCFPPQSMSMGGLLRPEMAIEHFKRISDASDLPLICFNYPSSRRWIIKAYQWQIRCIRYSFKMLDCHFRS